MKKKIDVLNGDINHVLTKMTVPMIFGIITIMLFNIIDTYYISLLGTSQLAAMGFIFPITFIITSAAIGLGIGASSNISRAIGEGDNIKVKRITSDAISLTLLLSLLIAAVFYIFKENIFSLVGAGVSTMGYILSYTSIWFVGVSFFVLQMVGNSAIRSTGETKLPSLIMIFGGILNAILDPLFIFGVGTWEGYGIAGAAMASLISWVIGLILMMYLLIYKFEMVNFKVCSFKYTLKSWKNILNVALPAIFTNVLTPISAAIITWYVANFGDKVVASIGLITRIESLLIIIILALSSTLPTFVGQNWGAKNIERIRDGIKSSFKFIMILQVLIALFIALTGKYIAGIFTDDTEIIKIVSYAMYIIPISYGFIGVTILSNSALNAINKPLNSLILNFTRLFILYVPLSMIGGYIYGVNGIFIGMFLANIIIGVISFFWIRKVFDCKKPDTKENKDIDRIVEPTLT